ncbi:hypothetical protein [Sphingosinithalassobacter sp. CS137]|uniref:hypothetical protein n=1 Tax=Sphingosinithalassobacter sp. CS137 TaxID=2762748 RepID=UPI00165D8691|nr:hypothetical protein [Sphingosinithalassobacter sp. CS137]
MTDATTAENSGGRSSRLDSARESASHAYEATRDRARRTAETTRDRARQTAETVGDNPLALLAGGIALGVLVGVLLPRHPRERELLDPLGKRLAEGATAAAVAARDAGKQELDQLLPSGEQAKSRASNVLESALGAARERVSQSQ